MSFNGISMGDGICQVLRSGSCFTLMYFDKNCLKIDLEITQNRRWARMISSFWVFWGRGGLFEKWRGQIECSGAQISEDGPHWMQSKSHRVQTIKRRKVQQKPVTFTEGSVMSLCVSQLLRLKSGSRNYVSSSDVELHGIFFPFINCGERALKICIKCRQWCCIDNKGNL